MDRIRAYARELRRHPTDAEQRLWQRLRHWQVDGCKFRRQQPVGHYIVDFVCLQKRLIVELDGGQHAEETDYDEERDGWLRDQRFVVLRFWNNDVLNHIDGVLELISDRLKTPPTSVLPRKGEGG